MYAFIYALSLIASLQTISHTIFDKVRVPVGERIVVVKVYDLPNTAAFQIEEERYLDLAVQFTEYNIGHILPLWIIEEPKLGGYDEIDNKYYEIPEYNLSILLNEQNLNRASLETVPLYNKYGGKIIVLLLLGIIVYGLIPNIKP